MVLPISPAPTMIAVWPRKSGGRSAARNGAHSQRCCEAIQFGRQRDSASIPVTAALATGSVCAPAPVVRRTPRCIACWYCG